MSAIVIYPAAFKDASASQAVSTPVAPHMTADATSAQVIMHPRASVQRDVAPEQMSQSPVAALQTIHGAAAQSAQYLHHAEECLGKLHEREEEMSARSQAISTASKDLGVQMERLIDETRRMVSYLRTERMI